MVSKGAELWDIFLYLLELRRFKGFHPFLSLLLLHHGGLVLKPGSGREQLGPG
ncbi:hypothetical protein JOB18_013225 [Solea senegalensis]|uniref:Uncharacterized protein n=1 Tax=Solea senegalensis TaxID=28829 RepID=A0AAV6Q7I5_SOLSE|nr:hypothetical protein JOB18_013225 [Solea senegalensis]